MKIRQKMISGFLVIVLLVAAVGVMCLYQLHRIAEPLRKDIPEKIREISESSRLDGLAQFIRYYDEVLTQSARNYAFTQDKKWEQRYRDVEPELDRIIKEAIEKGDAEDKVFFSSVDQANLTLVQMEYEAIEFVSKGQAGKAVKILEDQEYWNQKKIYEQGIRDYVRRKGIQYDEALATSTEEVELANNKTQKLIDISTLLVLIFVVVALMLSIGVGYLIYYSISNPFVKLKAAAVEIGAGHLDTQIEINSNDEIGQLAASFTKMTEDLRKSTTSIENLKKENICRKLAEETMRESEEKYRTLFTKMINGFAFHKIVVDEKGTPIDYIFLEINNAFEKLTGLKRENLIGKRVTEVLPGIEKDSVDWIGKYGKVALEGEMIHFENCVNVGAKVRHLSG
ncbi:MAG: HAMP domain-containing protein [bacterium]|nr:HAMP domain-containing protein [bacterium]